MLLVCLLAGEQDEDSLQYDDTAEIECNQHRRQRAVDEGAVDDDIYIVEAMAKDSDAQCERDDGQRDPSAS